MMDDKKKITKQSNTVSKNITDNAKYVELVHSGEDYFERLEKLINAAEKEIHLQTYIFENDETGSRIAACLKAAALLNVKIYVLLDAYGSAGLPDSFVQDLVQQGIFIRFFSPLFSLNNFYVGRRMHHKIVVADEKIALIGGINIGDKYRGTATSKPWLDYAVQLNCPASKKLQKLCSDYFFKKRNFKKIPPVLHSAGSALVGILQNDWLQRKTEVCDAYTNALIHAEKEIIIVGSYFLPGSRIAKALKKACARGTKTTVVLAGISDVPLIRRATEYLYRSLLDDHIRIFEWNGTVVHGKAMVVDDKWSTVGSFNLNSLSCYGSIEMNVEIYSQKFAENLRAEFELVISECSEITEGTLSQRSGIFNKLGNWVSYQIVRTTMFFLTFIPHLRILKNFRL